jgi:hypothetical protein
MTTEFMFAINPDSEEVLISESPQGSNQIQLIERVSRLQNELLFHAVVTLTCISQDPNLDLKLFKAMDKVCQMAYQKFKSDKSGI